jgi:hypothetical protein
MPKGSRKGPAPEVVAGRPLGARKIVFWRLDRMRPYMRNARTHTEEQIAHRLAEPRRQVGLRLARLPCENASQ